MQMSDNYISLFHHKKLNFIIRLLRFLILPRIRYVEKVHSLNTTPAIAKDRVAEAEERKTVSARGQG